MQRLRQIVIIAIAATSLFIASCGRSLSGTYVAQSTDAPMQMLSSVQFSGKGTAFVRVMGTDMAGKYRIEDNRVVVEMPSGSLVFLLVDDNTLEANVGGFKTVLKRQ